ncbi:MAG: triose-phosphate isomerase [Parcubacteria bacterium C7867-003]|nr:MAG: triose-phosphate isomerase [Parcubacteria bacterium C7867-003]
MKKMKKLIVGNWKMNPVEVEDAREIVQTVKRAGSKLKKSQVVVCPPFVYTSLFLKKSSNFFLGAQNANHEMLGSFTGEVSYSMLYQLGVRFVILGHSERRKMGETDELINRKVKSVVNGGMSAIVCVGESSRDHNGDYLEFIKKQIHVALTDIPKKLLSQVVIAYEPIWAVGAPTAMSPRDLHEMSIYIRKVLNDMFGIASLDARVIYGGAVDKVNAEELIREGNVSGFLVGRQSLVPKDFIEIMKAVDATK